MARNWAGEEARLDLSSTRWTRGADAFNRSTWKRWMINVNATLERMREFRLGGRTHACGNSSAVLNRLALGVVSQKELLEYAGLRSRDQLVRDCSAVDPASGNVISCLGDQVLGFTTLSTRLQLCVSARTIKYTFLYLSIP